jgi:glycine dehydrogenase subunit 2
MPLAVGAGQGPRGPGKPGLLLDEPLLFERSSPGRRGDSLPAWDVPHREERIPSGLRRDGIEGFPELSEVDVFRHFVRLSQWNYGVDSGPYPLGSCTMKYNPKVNERAARLPGFSRVHPLWPEGLVQGTLQVLFELEAALCALSGFPRVTLQPAAGAQGELTALMMIRACLADRGDPRRKVLVPDTAHGTNPASCTLNGYEAVEIKSGPRGVVEPEAVAAAMGPDVAAIMLTNPNTLGLFEEGIGEIAEIVHRGGGLVYCDGANFNSLMGRVRIADLGVDAMQFNLHKTFSTPHGGGGPGAGPVGVSEALIPYLPVPLVTREGDRLGFDYDRPRSIGKVRSFFGNFGVHLRAYTYIRELGYAGLRLANDMAVLNANYVRAKLSETYHLAYPGTCMHECVFTDKRQAEHGVKTLDIAKRLIDHGFHPPTIYFPLVVHGALMIEPTECESREALDELCGAFEAVSRECAENPEVVKGAPHLTVVGRLDETAAARKPVLRWKPPQSL